jgi:hypothetical protein
LKTYTFRVECSFALQYSFTESEIERDPDGGASDVLPTDPALSALRGELLATLSEKYPISILELCSESEDLLGVSGHDA